MEKQKEFILWFDQIDIADVPLVGGKNASLGEMYQNLTKLGVNIPNGFTITSAAYRDFIDKAGIEAGIRNTLRDLDVKDVEELAERGHKVRNIIKKAEFPEELKQQILLAYDKLCKEYGTHTDVAVRSSATAEDLPGASFAGQQETYLNIRGEAALLEACKNCFASLFTNRAIVYRTEKKFDHFSIALSIGVQKMVRSDKACSGVMFTIDTETGFSDAVLINASYGLGETIVQGAVNPDEFYVFKTTLKQGFKPILSRRVGEKKIKTIYSHEGNKPVKTVSVPTHDREKLVLKDEEVISLAKWGVIIEEHYTNKLGKYTPMDIEWAKDGVMNKLFIVQARPETIHSQEDRTIIQKYVLNQKGTTLLAKGSAVGEKIGQGKAHVIKDVHNMKDFREGEVLITDITDPDWVPIMKIASAIVTNRGGRSSHAAIVSRELGLPAVVGTNNATEKIRTGQQVTVSCAEGETGHVYEGILKYTIEKIDLKKLPKTKTKIMINIGSPEEAFKNSHLPVEGVGLAREEFIVNNYIKIHPMALVNYKTLKDAHVKKQIDELTADYKDKQQYFIDKLSEGIATIAAAFYPKDVILRLSDFKSNEYANLIGGSEFEPKEENPMIGWRGAARYYSEKYKPGFALECKAILKVREEMGLTNIKAMIPMCRTVDEGRKVIREMELNGLKQGKNGLEIYVMCEIPSNVILAEEFCKIFDGFSIGSNDLTQFTLGVDRDSELVSHVFDERNDAVKAMVAKAIETARKNSRKIGICGQAPSDFPEFAEFLVECGIDSISLNPDAVIKTILVVDKKERQISAAKKPSS
ncbi:phosphoenolpyruvate synthase [Candidatus Woesearchaeota archaeon]|nr:phosphoenolpyruvate synthase [Candidatus Woesearchaeota archaeon]